MQKLQGGVLRSVGTVRNYESALTRVAEWTAAEKISGGLTTLTPALAVQYLEQRGQDVGQKALDMERQAMQAMMQHVTGQLPAGERLPVIQSEHAQALSGRAYTPEQAQRIAAAQSEQHGLATLIAHAGGLRAHELLDLRRGDERAPDPRPALDSKWQGRDGVIYTVQGKGGLVREILVPHDLAARLEATRRDEPVRITDRGIYYQSHYDIGGGQRWSNSVSAASERVLGWSTGAHGLRHTYAQERMNELQYTLSRDRALETVSQEMGHFRPAITETYLR
ncbi:MULTISPECIES: site-specific integrase [Aeromonas]|nr:MULTISPECIES: site-specific integrase [unclassified Aeromonas]